MLARLALPALVVGVGCSLLLIGVSEAADALQSVLWETVPDALGIGRYSVFWMLVVLTATGLAVGLVVWRVHGHAGPDPATTGLVDPPLAPGVIPGLLLASMLSLAGGVSLGPENPITAANIALAYWAGMRLLPGGSAKLWASLAAAGTIGALFGTPVAAALVLSESLAASAGRPSAPPGEGDADAATRDWAVWDRLFAPLVAASAGGLTTTLITEPVFQVDLPPFSGPHWGDVVAALVVAPVGAVLGLLGVYAFPYFHRAFHALRHPVLMLTAGGVVLGLLGALGGHLTLFKGLEQIGELTESHHSAGALVGMALVKVAALVTASAAGFRGGRIFPAVFAGVSLGLGISELVPEVQPAVGVSCAVLGVLLATTREAWLSLFTAAVLVPTVDLLPLLCLASLPAWLLVTGRQQMRLKPDGSAYGARPAEVRPGPEDKHPA
ncbi:ion channel protein [Streptomyces sp. NPDC101132]|uniref:ion channel protein n=1 Tax=Streptomyces sp. NPDC101132 TaxID=3366110 RepID=UPI0038292214